MNTHNISGSEKEKVTRKLREALASLIKGCETLDMDKAFRIFHDSPEFLMMGTDGSICDYKTSAKNNIDYLKVSTAFQLKTFNEEIRILNNSTASLFWSYGVEAVLKTGETDLIEKAGATFVFKKIDVEWKVVCYHESSLPPVRIPDKNGRLKINRHSEKQNIFHGILVNRAFKEKDYPEKYKVFSRKESGDWILYGVEIQEEEIENAVDDIRRNMRTDDNYYSHVYNDETVIVIFNGRVFRITPHASGWDEVISYGKELGIGESQLDFWPNRFQDEKHYFS